ncbi:MAG TPA: IS256 family transposase [Firmicutes bacterium]|nr:IS256 family transposase [Bacillota bacterium]
MQSAEDALVKLLAKKCKTAGDISANLKKLFGPVLQEMLEAEMDQHLGYRKHSNEGDNCGNSRNGYSNKTIKTNVGEVRVSIPRDRNGEFEPIVVKKHERRISELEERVIAMYAKGMSTRDIQDHLKDLYGVNASASLISDITDRVMPLVTEWQSRPLERVYAIVFLDAFYFKVRKENRIVNKAVYTVIGINMAGFKDVLGIWIGEAESAAFWIGTLNDLRARGVEDILIVSTDGLAGFSEAINAVFPKTELQLCVIHQIRNTLKYVANKDRGPLMQDLKPVYKALTIEEAELNFAAFKESWQGKYPHAIKSWETHWLELTAFFKYPKEIRRIMYTTNTIESYHRRLRKVIKTKTAYPNDEALLKILYLATMDATKKWTQPLQDWGYITSQFTILFADRLREGDLT